MRVSFLGFQFWLTNLLCLFSVWFISSLSILFIFCLIYIVYGLDYLIYLVSRFIVLLLLIVSVLLFCSLCNGSLCYGLCVMTYEAGRGEESSEAVSASDEMLLYRGFEKPKERDCTAKKCISKMSQSCLYGCVFALLFQVRGNFVKPLKKQEEMWETNMTHKIKLWYLTFVGSSLRYQCLWICYFYLKMYYLDSLLLHYNVWPLLCWGSCQGFWLL